MSFEYKPITHKFSPGTVVEKVIREYNHPNMSQSVVDTLLKEYNEINKDVLPAQMGQEVKIPVLLPFCEKHEDVTTTSTVEPTERPEQPRKRKRLQLSYS